MPFKSLLPQNATSVERALERVGARSLDLGHSIGAMADPWTIPSKYLPWLAWARSIDYWREDWSEATKRGVIAASFEVHRRKGTPGGMKRALAAAGYGRARIEEPSEAATIGATTWGIGRDFRIGSWVGHWADYRVFVSDLVTIREVELIRAVLEATQPLRSRLRTVSIEAVQYTIGDGLWLIGPDIGIGSVYEIEETVNG